MNDPAAGGSANVAARAALGLPRLGEFFLLSPNPYVVIDARFTIIEANDAYLAVTARERHDIVGRNIFEAFPTDAKSVSGKQLRASFDRVLRTRVVDHLPLIRYDIQGPSGAVEERFWSATHTPLLDADGAVEFILQHTVDVTEMQRLRRFAEAARLGRNALGKTALVESDVFRRAQAVQETNDALKGDLDRLRGLFHQAPGFMAVLSGPHHVFELANRAYVDVVGQRTLVGRSVRDALPEVAAQGFIDVLDQVFATGEPYVGRNVRILLQTSAGPPARELFLDFVYQPVADANGRTTGIFVQGNDVTEERRAAAALAESERRLRHMNATLEEQVAERTRELAEREAALRQAQKMEVVGQLTGGIAHDFNNLLQIVVGNLEILQRNLATESGRLRRAADNAMNGARRAATLTQRLLAFSRRQPLDPKPFNPNKLVSDMSELLHRTLGEAVSVETVLAAGLWHVDADANQLESAILNLAVNSRDAMPNGGKLTIETANARLDDNYARATAEVSPGQYVVICVSDTGVGMDRDTLARVFEPFFTTKEVGRGTGLGLSMVYGFVKQSGGHVSIYSEADHGTTVKIYLPRHLGAEEVESAAPDLVVPEGTHDETILVLEDDDDVRTYSVEILRELGYRVIEAHDGASALRLLERQSRVDLLFTDVILPGGATGADVARAARLLRPDLRVLFTTGYARDAIVHHGRLAEGVELITKPFSYGDLARKVRDVLDRAPDAGFVERP